MSCHSKAEEHVEESAKTLRLVSLIYCNSCDKGRQLLVDEILLQCRIAKALFHADTRHLKYQSTIYLKEKAILHI